MISSNKLNMRKQKCETKIRWDTLYSGIMAQDSKKFCVWHLNRGKKYKEFQPKKEIITCFSLALSYTGLSSWFVWTWPQNQNVSAPRIFNYLKWSCRRKEKKLGGDPSSSFCFQSSPLPWMYHDTFGDNGVYKSASLKLSDKCTLY